MTQADAIAAGYRPLTTAYLSTEADLLAGVIKDMQRGRIAYQLIEAGPGQTEVWRKGLIVTDRRRNTNTPGRFNRD